MIEVSISIVVIGTMLVASLSTIGATRTNMQHTSDRARGRLLAQQLMSEIMVLAYEDPDAAAGSFGLEAGDAGTGSRALFDDVDDFDGWLASPPQSKAGTVLTGLASWTRSAEVSWVDPDDLQRDVGVDTRIKRVTVAVTHNARVVASMTVIRTGPGVTATLVPPPVEQDAFEEN